MVRGTEITVEMKGDSDIANITEYVEECIKNSTIIAGIVNISVIGSTASISTIEYEPALVEDMRDHLQTFAPREMKTRHGDTWGDDNGYSHIRATFMGPGITLPFAHSKLILGTWQQVIVIDHDNRPRSRKIYIQIIGE